MASDRPTWRGAPESEDALRVLHLANHKSTNIGNGALVLGLERTLAEDFARPVHFVHEAWDDYTIPGAPKTFDERFVELCNHFDLVVVGAAVTFVGSREHEQTGMRFALPLHLWDGIEPPLVFYGLSYRTWPSQTYHHRDRLREAVEAALAYPRMLFSVRNDGTKDWLAALLDLDLSHVHEVPDPALYVPPAGGRPYCLSDPDGGGIDIAVSLNDEDARHRFEPGPAPRQASLSRRIGARLAGRSADRGWVTNRHAFLRELAGVLDAVAAREGVRIHLCPHHHEDFRLVADFFDVCSSRLKHQVVGVHELPHATRAPHFYDLYRCADLTLAMRVHAMSPSVGLGTPTLALCSQRRMSAFMRDAGLEDHALDIFDTDFAQRLRKRVGTLLGDGAGARRAVTSAVERLRERTRAFDHRVERLVTTGVRS
jgi:hypothetical protein